MLVKMMSFQVTFECISDEFHGCSSCSWSGDREAHLLNLVLVLLTRQSVERLEVTERWSARSDT